MSVDFCKENNIPFDTSKYASMTLKYTFKIKRVAQKNVVIVRRIKCINTPTTIIRLYWSVYIDVFTYP